MINRADLIARLANEVNSAFKRIHFAEDHLGGVCIACESFASSHGGIRDIHIVDMDSDALISHHLTESDKWTGYSLLQTRVSLNNAIEEDKIHITKIENLGSLINGCETIENDIDESIVKVLKSKQYPDYIYSALINGICVEGQCSFDVEDTTDGIRLIRYCDNYVTIINFKCFQTDDGCWSVNMTGHYPEVKTVYNDGWIDEIVVTDINEKWKFDDHWTNSRTKLDQFIDNIFDIVEMLNSFGYDDE